MALSLSVSPYNSENNIRIINKQGQLINIEVVRIKGTQVVLAIDAEMDYFIYREKVFNKILRENHGKIPGTDYVVHDY